MLISEGYAAQQAHLHATTEYGTAGESFAPLVAQIIETLQVQHLLDYGCGSRMSLLNGLQKQKVKGPFTYQAYDPGAGSAELATDPIPAQMVACIDVLEHIEPDCLDSVLNHIQTLTEAVAFLSIHTGPAYKVLPDGRNAHLTQQPMAWWLPKIWSRFDIQTVQQTHAQGFYVIAAAKPLQLEAVSGEKLLNEPIIITGD